MLTQARLKEFLSYDAFTGVFTQNTPTSRTPKGTIVGYKDSYGYLMIEIDDIQYLLHRLAFLYVSNYLPEKVDHIDGNPLNNTWENLREASAMTNAWNRKTPITNKSTGIKGITKAGNSYYCQVVAEGKKYRNIFSAKRSTHELALQEAIAWVTETRVLLHGEFSNHG